MSTINSVTIIRTTGGCLGRHSSTSEKIEAKELTKAQKKHLADWAENRTIVLKGNPRRAVYFYRLVIENKDGATVNISCPEHSMPRALMNLVRQCTFTRVLPTT